MAKPHSKWQSQDSESIILIYAILISLVPSIFKSDYVLRRLAAYSYDHALLTLIHNKSG